MHALMTQPSIVLLSKAGQIVSTISVAISTVCNPVCGIACSASLSPDTGAALSHWSTVPNTSSWHVKWPRMPGWGH